MAIRSKGIVTVNNGDVDLNEFKESLYDLFRRRIWIPHIR